MKSHFTMAGEKKPSIESLSLLGLASLLWLAFRTGTKPSRIVYPCQRAALANSTVLLGALIPISITTTLLKTKRFFFRRGKNLALLLILISAIMSIELFVGGLQPARAIDPYQEIQLTLEAQNATAFPASDIYVVNGPASAHVNKILNLMGSHGLLFYRSNASGVNQGSDGLIARDDVVLIKTNEQWSQRGGTNTDILKEIIQAIVDHPDGFAGEIIVADNGQGSGSMDWPQSNAEDTAQSTRDVVDTFSPSHRVSIYDWQPIRSTRVDEYSEGDMRNGYILYDIADPETGIYVSYPKFETVFGTYISFKYGVWNGTEYEKRLKVINVPVLKSHSVYGVTASLKHYMGVQSQSLGNGHVTVGTGGMGTLLVETGLPILNIMDAIWINANPPPSSLAGPSTSYSEATRVNVLMASTDPVALDYWAAKHVLVQAASSIGYSDIHTLDPDNTDKSGVSGEAFGVWLDLTEDEIASASCNVTTAENHMNVHVYGPAVHDVGLSDVSSSKTVVGQGYSTTIDITARNYGSFSETFNITAYCNETAIILPDGKTYTTITLLSGTYTTITFLWNTSGLSKGSYITTAVADKVPGETDLIDNMFEDGTIVVAMPCDIAGSTGTPPAPSDGRVDYRDLFWMLKAYGSNPALPHWDPNLDFAGSTATPPTPPDHKVDYRDLFWLLKYYGTTDP